MAYQNNWENEGLYRVFTGTTRGDEALRSNLALHGDARFDVIKYVLNDFTAIQDYEITEKDVQIVACIDDVAAISKPVLKIAIVATLEPLLKWIEMYVEKMEGSPYECKIFSSVEDARKWLLT